jgi:hypothetical protein
MNTLIPIIIVAVVLIFTLPYILAYLNKRRDRVGETTVDVHEMIQHKFKKIARKNIRGTRIKWLYSSGDNDYPGYAHARMYGIMLNTFCAEIFAYNGRKHLSKVSWYRAPLELCGDVCSNNFAVDCRGWRAKANYFQPIWPTEIMDAEGKFRKVTKEDIVRWETVIDDSMRLFVEQEKYEEVAYEQNLNASLQAVSATPAPTVLYQRDEHLRSASSEQVLKAEEEPQS